MALPPKNALKILSEFAKVHDLVEFGAIKDSDEFRALKGVTFHKEVKDRYYAFGSTNNREVALLYRDFSFHKDAKTYSWVILAAKLRAYDIPRLFIDAHQADNDLYIHLIDVLGAMTHVSEALHTKNPSFSKHWHVFSRLQDAYLLDHFLQDSITQGLYDYYQNMSFEVDKDYLYVYIDASLLTNKKLESMLQSGLWLAEHFEYSDAQLHQDKIT